MIMQTYIEQVRTEPRKYIQSRTACQRFLKVPSTIAAKGVPIMFRDKWMTFSQFFLMGLDFDFLMLDILVITFIDIVGMDDTTLQSRLVLGVLIAYMVDNMLLSMREYFGRRNLA